MAILRLKNTGARMDQNRHVQFADLFIERPQHRCVEIAICVAAHELDAFEAQLSDRSAQFPNRFIDVRQVNPGNADEALSTGNVFGDRIVVSARHRVAQIAIHFIYERPVVGDHDLVIKSFPFHHVMVHVEIPTSLAERMNFLAVTKISRGVAGKLLAVADHFTGAFGYFDMSPSGMIHAFDKPDRPVVSITVDVHVRLLALISWNTPRFYGQLETRSTGVLEGARLVSQVEGSIVRGYIAL